jgi:hypothetical protein
VKKLSIFVDEYGDFGLNVISKMELSVERIRERKKL